MSDTPIPTGPSLLGAWFFDERFYDAGRDRVTPLTPVGYPAELKNGITVGVEGDPSRDFGAADFDAGSNQFADVGDPLAVDGDSAVAAILKVESGSWEDGAFNRIISNASVGTVTEGLEVFLNGNNEGSLTVKVANGSGGETNSVPATGVSSGEYWSVTTAVSDGEIITYVNGELVDTDPISGYTASTLDLIIGARTDAGSAFDGEIAAVGRYDLTAPNAPEPSEIARRWDRLTDIPATR